MELINQYFHLISTAIMLAWFILGLFIKNKIQEIKDENITHRNEMIVKQTIIANDLKHHIDEDNKFQISCDKKLDKIWEKIDKQL